MLLARGWEMKLLPLLGASIPKKYTIRSGVNDIFVNVATIAPCLVLPWKRTTSVEKSNPGNRKLYSSQVPLIFVDIRSFLVSISSFVVDLRNYLNHRNRTYHQGRI